MTNALALIESTKPLEIFNNNGLDPIIEKIEKEVKAEVYDISTSAGRDRIKSVAYKIGQTKNALDKMGKELVSGWKEQAKKVDVERSRAWDRLEFLQKEIRQPLTEWEEAENTRIAKHEADIAEIVNGGAFTQQNWQSLSVEAMSDRLKEIESLTTWTWQEFGARAKHAIDEAAAKIRDAIQKRTDYDAQQSDLERLRREDAERKQREHEERLKAEAAAKAKAEAEAVAQKAAEAEAIRVKAEQEKAERERQRIQQEKEEAEARAQKAEADRLAAITKAEADSKAAEEKARLDAIAAEDRTKREAEAAVQRERDRIEAERRTEAEAAAKREADKKHRAKINNEALDALLVVLTGDNLLTAEAAGKAVIAAIAKGEILHIKIQY